MMLDLARTMFQAEENLHATARASCAAHDAIQAAFRYSAPTDEEYQRLRADLDAANAAYEEAGRAATAALNAVVEEWKSMQEMHEE